jgi:inorganic pyrophosphatase
MSNRDLSKLRLKASADAFTVVIETPLGSHSKYNYNPELDVFELKDTLPRGTEFPFDFGFFPSTLAEDGDPLDALVLSDRGLAVGIVLQARLIGVIEVETSEGEKTMRNDRLVAIPVSSVIYKDIGSLSDLPPVLLDQVETFFKYDSAFKGKQVEFPGRGDRAKAKKLLSNAAKKFAGEAGQPR